MMRLEQTILKNLVYNEEFTRKVLPFIQIEYFSDSIERKVFKEIQDFVNRYEKLPSHEALVINFTEKKELTEDEVSKSVELLHELKKTKEEKVDITWLTEQSEKFCQDKAIYNAIMDSVSILDDKNTKKVKGEIPKLLSDALGVSFDRHVGHDYMDDYNERYDFYHKVETRTKFDLDLMNKITKGGLPDKTLNVLMAGTGVGKSLFMCHMASACLSQGDNVLYITLEMAEEKIAERIDANLLNVSLNELRSVSKEDYETKFQVLKSKTQGKLIIKEYPTAAASTLHFRALLSELAMKKQFKPDIIFIDYLNICSSSRVRPGGTINSYVYVKAIAEELRGLAVEYELPVVSATQTTRSGFTNSDPGLEDVSESFGLPATADFMISLVSNEQLEELNQIMVKQQKNRYNDPSYYKKFILGVDRAKMRLYDVEQGGQDDILGAGQDNGGPDKPLNTFGTKERFDGFKV
jgi:replicative DNA helicase